MYPRRDTAIRHYDVQPHCLILKQGECRSARASAARRERLRLRESSPCPTKISSGSCAMTNVEPWRRAVTPPSPHQQRRQVYHRSGSPGHRRTRNRRRAGSPIAYSLLLDRRCAPPRGAIGPRIPARSRNLPSACVPASAADPVRLDFPAMQHDAAWQGKPAYLVSSTYAAGCGMSRAAEPAFGRGGPGTPFATRTERERACWHGSPRVCTQIHTRRSIGRCGTPSAQGRVSVWARSLMMQARRGNRALIVRVATC
jgi:hypothetical protein